MTTPTTLPPTGTGTAPSPEGSPAPSRRSSLAAAGSRQSNLAGRIAGWSARHRRAAVLGWLLFVVAATALSAVVGTVEVQSSESGHGDSRRADEIIAAAGFPDRAAEMVLVQSDTLVADDPAFRAAVADTTAAVERTGRVLDVRSDAVSADRHAVLVTFDLTGPAEDAADRVGPVRDAVAAVQRAHPELYVAQTGGASIGEAIGRTLDADMHRLSMLSIPVTLGILVIAFGALLAAVLPMGLALTAFLGSLGLLAVVSRIAPAVDTTMHLMLLMGLAVGVDYCLFYLRREREERARGASAERALAIAAATSGRSVLISALTVIIAMSGMFLTQDATFVSMATGTILVVATAGVGSLTVLPAVLSKLGDRIDLGRVPGIYRRQSSGRFWRATMRVVLRRPGVSATLAAAALLVLAVPLLGMRTAEEDVTALRKSAPALSAFVHVKAAFPGGAEPAVLAIRADDVTTPALTAAIAELKTRALATGQLHEPVSVEVNPDRTVAVVKVGLAGSGVDAASEQAVRTLREQVVPRTVQGVDGAEVLVTGQAADSVDFNAALARSVPLVFGFVLGLAFLLMLVSFRSVVVAATAIVLNLLSVAAAYGLLVLVFQHGWGEALLGFESVGSITNWVPLFLFVILFGLSMDYHVFVLSRIREGHDRGWPSRLAVSRGIRGTAGVITSAAVVMVAVFALFTTGTLVSMKELGFGLAVAVLIDATVVRAVLLPAVMVLLGERNWYLPRWLGWLPRLSHEEPPDALPPTEPIGAEPIGAEPGR
ncbi:MMPL family transporter [Micromonospora sp. WMMD1102]|uniref:MMPL family transporter n=1 Tax=Micromonospora sp. WMMD1102 TaxID=3016105 RepID=UPI0024152CD8|nr:MMPL family transporter [Micromonospora sp. WMMD1102]MDG4784710.1 MMPL family transporter [Micromonospora sp. WMMD1102]